MAKLAMEHYLEILEHGPQLVETEGEALFLGRIEQRDLLELGLQVLEERDLKLRLGCTGTNTTMSFLISQSFSLSLPWGNLTYRYRAAPRCCLWATGC